MRSGIRSTDELVRYGCDKFVVVMPNIPSDDFTRRLHQVSDAVRSTIIPGHEYVSLTACVGGVLIHGETVDEGVGRAVQLLSRAKAKAGTVVTDADSIEAFQSEKPLVLIVDDSEMNEPFSARCSRTSIASSRPTTVVRRSTWSTAMAMSCRSCCWILSCRA